MNLELIRKYLPEFNSYVKGQPLTLGYKTHWGTYEWTDLVWADWDSSINEHIIIINDEYLPYRKALAEGKTVQYMNSNGEIKSLDDWDNIGWKQFKGCVENYRIKPDEPEFKVGDWITVNGPTGTFTECISGIADDTYTLSGTNICYKSQASKWEPKEDEVCIFWDNHSAGAFIDKFKYLSNNGKYHTERSFWITCMPFTGILPPHMKD